MQSAQKAESPCLPPALNPPPRTPISAHSVQQPSRARALELHGILRTARELDRLELELIHRGEAFFHVGGAGHESSAALAAHLLPDDWLHLHYRDKALMLARGLPSRSFFDALVCNAESSSGGRQMCAHPSSAALHLLSLPGPVGNGALQAVGVALEEARRHPGRDTVTLCSVGDGTTQQGEFLEAVAEAVRNRLRVLFLIEDNRYAISTATAGRTFFDLPDGRAEEFYGLPLVRLDGRDVLACDARFGGIVSAVRRDGGPAIVLLRVERLTHHTNADDERIYRTLSEIESVKLEADPLTRLETQLTSMGIPSTDLEQISKGIRSRLREEAEEALVGTDPLPEFEARAPLPEGFPAVDTTPHGDGRPRTLLEALREALEHRLASDPRSTLSGQDIEDPKGDVFGLTRGLSTRFPGRVLNAPLSESTIVGTGIGRALAGGRPVGFIQFADFLPLAYNQIASELGSLHWRTRGEWQAPLVLLSPCGGYRPGLGPFHASSAEGTYVHVPGLDVFLPSNAADAAGLLNAAFASGRPTLFLYPKVLLNDPAAASPLDPTTAFVVPGTARTVLEGDDLTLVSWGATVGLCRRAAERLSAAGVAAGILDLRTLAPWDSNAVLKAVRRSRRLVVVHEDNHTCGFGAEVAATVAEKAGVPVEIRRVTRADTYIPCHFGNQLEVLPSVRRILEAAAGLCGLELSVEEARDGQVDEGFHVLEAVGSSPADQSVSVTEWKIAEGTRVQAGDLLAECEADKASFDLRSPVAGVLTDRVGEGERLRVGSPLARIRLESAPRPSRRIPREPRFHLSRRATGAPASNGTAQIHAASGNTPREAANGTVTLSAPAFVQGSVRVTNGELAARFPGRTAGDIEQRTGIVERFHCGPGEDALTLATAAARKALDAAGLTPADLDGLYVSTSTPLAVSPSLACRLQQVLGEGSTASADFPAVDLFAACSGYLYALQAAFDACVARPGSRILVVTTEAMSHFVDPLDFDTAIVFGDAATATVVHGTAAPGPSTAAGRIRLRRPVLGARGEDGSILSLGRMTPGSACTPVAMDGLKVFQLAVRQMPAVLERACGEAAIPMAALDWIVPHQANGRILQAVQRQTGIETGRFFNNVAHHGNTSSSTLPIALAEMLAAGIGGTAGLCAFGGGFTFGAALAVLEPTASAPT